MKALETPRLLLHPFHVGDLADTHRRIYADPDVAPSWTARTKTIEEIQASFAAKVAQRETDFGFLAVVLKTSKQLIGTVALQRYLPGDDTRYIVLASAPDYQVGGDPTIIEVELTYALGRACWGHGDAAEAGRALIELGFKEMGVSRIINSVNSENIHSINLMHRLGFHLEKNLYPHPFSDPNTPGVIGILNHEEA